ncbi:hypothetical protein [Streptomyces sp. bgisy029]|uniref:hypothetical protein n=1 Tax=Streptomyces sp. bgisy029 TaxID=3413771 RepID=UPI003D7628CB
MLAVSLGEDLGQEMGEDLADDRRDERDGSAASGWSPTTRYRGVRHDSEHRSVPAPERRARAGR